MSDTDPKTSTTDQPAEPKAEPVECTGYLLVDEQGEHVFVNDAGEIETAAAENGLLGGYRVYELNVTVPTPRDAVLKISAPADAGRLNVTVTEEAAS